MNEKLRKKEQQAINLIRAAAKIAQEHEQPLEVCYSGGKDSDVILHLTQKANVGYRAIYKNTTIDPPYTIRHAQEKGAEIRRPTRNFREVIAWKGTPSRLVRSCCSTLKEYKIYDYTIVGVRRAESAKRAARYKEPVQCRTYKNGTKCRQYFPILEWTDEEVAEYINAEGIKCHPLYYDENGLFHVERRLGCMGCPLQSREKRIEEFKKYPKMLNLYILGEREFREKHGNKSKFVNEYEPITFQLFCDRVAEFREKFGANMFFPAVDCKKFLEEYFHTKLV